MASASELGNRAHNGSLALFLGAGLCMLRMARSRGPDAALAAEPRIGYLHSLRTVMSVPWARRILLVTLIEGAFVFSSLAFIPAFLHERFGMSLARLPVEAVRAEAKIVFDRHRREALSEVPIAPPRSLG